MDTNVVRRNYSTDANKKREKDERETIVHTKLPRPLHAHPDEDKKDIFFWVAVILSQAVGMTCVGLVIYWCKLNGGFSWNNNADLQFNYHPLLMILGLIFFYGDAMIVYRVLSFLPKNFLKIVHALLHIFAILSSSVGLAAVLENHRRTEKADFYSLHSWVGIGTFAFFCFQYVGSFITFMYPGLPNNIRGKILPIHTFFGVGLFILAVATAEMGLTEKLFWTKNYTSGKFVLPGAIGNILGLLLIVFAALIVFITTYAPYKRKPLPFEIQAAAVVD